MEYTTTGGATEILRAVPTEIQSLRKAVEDAEQSLAAVFSRLAAVLHPELPAPPNEKTLAIPPKACEMSGDLADIVNRISHLSNDMKRLLERLEI